MSDEITWLSTAAAADRLGITPRTLYRFIDEGQLAAYKFGRVIPQAARRRRLHRVVPRRARLNESPLSRNRRQRGVTASHRGRSSERRFTRCQRPCGWVASIAVGQTPRRVSSA